MCVRHVSIPLSRFCIIGVMGAISMLTGNAERQCGLGLPGEWKCALVVQAM